MAVDVAHLPSVHDVTPAPRIAVSFVRPIALGLARFGIVPAEFFGALGLPADARDGYAAMGAFARAVDDVAERLSMPHISMDLVRMVPLGVLGATDYSFSTSATLLDGLSRISSHIGMFTETTRFELHVEGKLARIEQRHLYKPLGILTEVATGFAVRRLRDVLGEAAVKLDCVRFMHRARAPAAPYEEFFGAPVRFEGETDDFAFPRELLMAPLLTAHGSLAKILAARRPAATPKAPLDPLVDRVRALVVARLEEGAGEGALAVEELATPLEMSPRTLQRKLREAGSSCSDIIDDARRELAEKLLAREGTLLISVAYRLGFQDFTAFCRAFRRWTGTSPRAFQKALKDRG